MNGPVVVFALIAIAVNTTEVGGPAGSQTIGYYATAGECQKDLIRLYNTADRSLVRLDCKPLKVSE
jgi:hypothetical protein